MAQHGVELLNIAKQCQRNIYYEASVGGGIPDSAIKHCLAGNKIKSVMELSMVQPTIS